MTTKDQRYGEGAAAQMEQRTDAAEGRFTQVPPATPESEQCSESGTESFGEVEMPGASETIRQIQSFTGEIAPSAEIGGTTASSPSELSGHEDIVSAVPKVSPGDEVSMINDVDQANAGDASKSNEGEPYKVGYGRPPKESQFKPGQSGNRRGRPRKPRHALTPSQRNRDVLTVADMIIPLRTPAGTIQVTISQAMIYAIAMKGIKGDRRSAMNWLELEASAIRERLKRHPTVLVIEHFQTLASDPRFPAEPEIHEALDAHIEMMKGVY